MISKQNSSLVTEFQEKIMAVARVRTIASRQDGSWFESWLGQGLSVWSLHVLPVTAGVLVLGF